MRFPWPAFACPLLILALSASGAGAADILEKPSREELKAFASALETLAGEHHLAGLSAALVLDEEVIWSGGFGYADIENRIPARPDTPYRLASLSKPLAAVILMMLVEEGKLDLKSRMSEFAVHPWFESGGGSWAHYPERYRAPITVEHVLTHTSQANPPGSGYNYNGNIFADLTWVIEDVTRTSYPNVLRERIFEPLNMTRSLPGQLAPRGKDVVAELSLPYDVTSGEANPAFYPGFGLDPEIDVTPWKLDPAYRVPAGTVAARRELLGDAFTPLYSCHTAAGVISTVEDLARFDAALDKNELLSKESKNAMFTPARAPNGRALPYGLGWFVEEHEGRTVMWHYGWYPPTVSALYIKVPDRRATLILLSNCDGLSAGVSWSLDGVRASPFARLFLDTFLAN